MIIGRFLRMEKVVDNFGELVEVTAHQLKNLYFLSLEEKNILLSAKWAYSKCMHCLSNLRSKYFLGYINPYNTVMYCNWLYWLSRFAYLQDEVCLADKIYCLNKALHSVDLFYAIELPSVWSCEHPVGSVMGRATFGDGFVFLQGCTVGGNRDREGNLYYPVIGKNVLMYSGSKIIGKSVVGDDCIISANTYVKDAEIPNGSMVFGSSPNLVIKRRHM